MFDDCEVECPETCPCGKDNGNADGSPVFERDPAFCSQRCLDAYIEDCKRWEDQQARAYNEAVAMIAKANANCPTGECVKYTKLCRHIYADYTTPPDEVPGYYGVC